MIALGWGIAAVAAIAGGVGMWRRRAIPAEAAVIGVSAIAIAIWNVYCGYYLRGPIDHRLSAVYLAAVSVAVTGWMLIAHRAYKHNWWPPRYVSAILIAQPTLLLLSALLPADAWGRLFWPPEPWQHEPYGIAYGLHSPYCMIVIAAGAAPLVSRLGEGHLWDRLLAGGAVGSVACGVGAQLAGFRAMPYTAFIALLLMVAILVRNDPGNLRWLARAAEKDALTGTLTRGGLEGVLRRAVEQAGPADPLSLMIVDLDAFKEINDTHGHLAGDVVLRHVGQRLCEVTGGVVGRFGGDELVVVLPSTGAERALEIAHQLTEVAQIAVLDGHAPVRPTLSIGVAEYVGGGVEALLHAADQAMYVAKRAGGNGVACASEVAA